MTLRYELKEEQNKEDQTHRLHKFVSGRLYMQNGRMWKIKFKEMNIRADETIH